MRNRYGESSRKLKKDRGRNSPDPFFFFYEFEGVALEA